MTVTVHIRTKKVSQYHKKEVHDGHGSFFVKHSIIMCTIKVIWCVECPYVLAVYNSMPISKMTMFFINIVYFLYNNAVSGLRI